MGIQNKTGPEDQVPTPTCFSFFSVSWLARGNGSYENSLTGQCRPLAAGSVFLRQPGRGASRPCGYRKRLAGILAPPRKFRMAVFPELPLAARRQPDRAIRTVPGVVQPFRHADGPSGSLAGRRAAGTRDGAVHVRRRLRPPDPRRRRGRGYDSPRLRISRHELRGKPRPAHLLPQERLGIRTVPQALHRPGGNLAEPLSDSAADGGRRSLLAQTYRSVESIAGELGYCSVFDFSAKFKAYTGLSPSEFRKKAREPYKDFFHVPLNLIR